MTPRQQFEFAEALEGLFAGTLAVTDRAQLVTQLVDDEEAFSLYNRMISLDIALEWSFGTRCEQDVPVLRPFPANAAARQLSVNASNSSFDSSSLVSKIIGFISVPVLRYAALVALCLYGSFVFIAWNLRPDKLNDSNKLVAVMRHTTDVQWAKSSSSKPAESAILAGEPLKIDSGTLELELKMGTKLVVEGPAEWSVDGLNSVSLLAGKLVARVPEKAIGFTVETPIAKVVDLGTEFAVEVRESGTTDVQVTKGKVELHPGEKANNLSLVERPITITAGDARRVERVGSSGGVIVRNLAATETGTIPQATVVAPTELQQIRVEGAYASSTDPNPVVDARYLIDGSGFTGDHYSSVVSQYNMWHSAAGHIKNVIVSFDLARAYRLHSMKVWNFNGFDGTNLRVGVKQADLFVSTSGKGDPLSRPGEWKRIVVDQQFAPATGTPGYATPTIVPLADVEARFVAIVVDEAFGHDPRGVEYDSVGLSEVQIWGSRVEPPKPQTKQQEK